MSRIISEDDGAIQLDRYDRRIWNQVVEDSPRISKAEQSEYGGFLKDIWGSLYKTSPQINENGPLHNKRVIQTMMQQSVWKDLRSATQLDEYSAALGSLNLHQKLDDIIPENIKQAARNLQTLQQEVQKLLDQAEMYQDTANYMTNESTQDDLLMKAEQLRQQANDLSQSAQEAAEAFMKSYDENEASLGKSIRQAMEQVVEESQENEQMMCAWGAGSGNGQSSNGKERIELAQTLQHNKKLKEIARLAGRMQMMALNKRRNRTTHPPTEVINVTTSSDIAHVLPSELLLLADQDTEDEFFLRFAEGRLLTYDLQGFERQGQGPIVVCIDESGSTKGEIERWEKAIALSLFAIASREKRAFAVIHFGDSSEIKMDRWEKPHKDAKPMDLISMAEHFFNGGTSFEEPLMEAVKIMEESAFKHGDCIFITDGAAEVSSEFLEQFQRVKEQKEFQVISVVIKYSDHKVRPFSDQIAKVETVVDSEGDKTLNFIVESLN